MHVAIQDPRRHLLNRRSIVQDPNAAAMGCEDKIVLPRMNQNVVHRNIWEVLQIERKPFPAPIVRSEQPKLGARVEQVRVLWILAHNLHVSLRWQISGNALPGFSTVARLENVRTKIVEHVAITGHICNLRAGTRRLNM